METFGRKTRVIDVGSHMHHCASLIQDRYGSFWLAFYLGPECTDDQHVVVQHYVGDEVNATLHLRKKTGNPVLFESDGDIYLIFSEFGDHTEEGEFVRELALAPVERWKYCRNFIAKVVDERGELHWELHLKEEREIPNAFGLLTRQTPIKLPQAMAESWGYTHVIGMYREQNPLCCLWGWKSDRYEGSLQRISYFAAVEDGFDRQRWYMSPLGEGVAIQPALLVEGNRLFAFCRNVARVRGNDCRAWMMVTSTGGNWTTPVQSIIPSHNNSVAVCSYLQRPWVVCSTNEYRNDLWLIDTRSRTRIDLRVPIGGRRWSYSYPNMWVDNDERLHVVHTNCQRIAWHTFDKAYMVAVTGKELQVQPTFFRQMSKRRGGKLLRGLAKGGIFDPAKDQDIVSNAF